MSKLIELWSSFNFDRGTKWFHPICDPFLFQYCWVLQSLLPSVIIYFIPQWKVFDPTFTTDPFSTQPFSTQPFSTQPFSTQLVIIPLNEWWNILHIRCKISTCEWSFVIYSIFEWWSTSNLGGDLLRTPVGIHLQLYGDLVNIRVI
jgi:hypothetical protein